MKSMRQCTTNRAISRLLTFVLAVLLVPSAGLAQVETGQIAGTVTDPQGAVVPGAAITVTSRDTGATRTLATTSYGTYTVTNLQPGNYTVKIEATGFGTKTIPVQVTVGTKTTVDVELAVTVAGETVDVVAGAGGVQVNTENQTLQTVVTQTAIRELPTVSRNVYDLVALSGNISPRDPTGRGVGYAINGQRAASTNVMLDGADNNDYFNAAAGQYVPLDSVQEFTVLTSNFTAEFGRAAGGIVNVATKSGTNEFHGTVFEFNRVSALASQDFELNALYPPAGQDAIKKGVFTRNQFGYSVGGPIVRDRLLFFNAIEWTRVRSWDTVFTLVLTPEFLAASAPATRAALGGYTTTTPINGRILTAGQLRAEGVSGSAFDALAPDLPVLGQVIERIPTDAGAGGPADELKAVGRVDFNWTDATTIYGRYAFQSQDLFEGTVSYSPYAGFNTGATNVNNNVLVSLTHVWSDNFVSQSKFVFNRLHNNRPLGDAPVGPRYRLGVFTLDSNPIALPGYYVDRFGGPQNLSQFYEDQTWTVGDHAVRFGGSYVRIHDDRTFGAYESATVQIGSVSLSSSLDDLLAGTYYLFSVAIDAQGRYPGDLIRLPVTSPSFERNNRYNEGALYVNDAWRVHPRVTLNLGLRWDYFGVQHNTDPSLDSNLYYGPGTTLDERIANGRVMLAEESPVGGLWRKDLDNFGPRIGVAWDVFGDGKTSLRGGYGISYERNFGNVTFDVIQNPPNYAVMQLFGNGAPIVSDNFGPLGSGTGTVTLPRSSLRHVDENIRTAYAHFWSAAVEHEFCEGLVASVEYSGSAGRDLYSISSFNLPFSALVFDLPWAPEPNPGVQPGNDLAYSHPRYREIDTRTNGGRSNYNALNLGVDSRTIGGTGLQFQANYTWSHTLDNLSSTFSEVNKNRGFLDPNNPDLDYGPADFDIRHRLVSSGIWEIPFANDAEGWLRHLLDGWQLTYVYTARSGSPFTAYDCTHGLDRCIRLLNAGNLTLTGPDDPPEVAGPNPDLFNYIDLTNQLPQAGTFTGNATAAAYAAQSGLEGGADYGPFPSNMTGRNMFRRPGYWNLDAGVYKNFELTERTRLQVRAEIYNVFNHANLYAASLTAFIRPEMTEAHIRGIRFGRRHMQLGVKLIF
jgi:outer membrane receptor protein involved in Fe transport